MEYATVCILVLANNETPEARGRIGRIAGAFRSLPSRCISVIERVRDPLVYARWQTNISHLVRPLITSRAEKILERESIRHDRHERCLENKRKGDREALMQSQQRRGRFRFQHHDCNVSSFSFILVCVCLYGIIAFDCTHTCACVRVVSGRASIPFLPCSLSLFLTSSPLFLSPSLAAFTCAGLCERNRTLPRSCMSAMRSNNTIAMTAVSGTRPPSSRYTTTMPCTAHQVFSSFAIYHLFRSLSLSLFSLSQLKRLRADHRPDRA